MSRWFRLLTQLDWVLVIVPVLLIGVGLVMIYVLAFAQDRPTLFWSQLTYVGVAGLAFLVALSINVQSIRQVSPWLYGLALLLLGLVLFIGRRTLGAVRWINLGSFQLQPAELMKLCLLLLIARLISVAEFGRMSWRRFGVVLAVAAIPIILVVLQPDLGTAIMLASITVTLLLSSRLTLKQLGVSFGILIVTLGVGWLSLRGYQRQRIEVFLNPSSNANTAESSGYNVRQSIIAVGSGGLTGEGIGRGSQSQLNFLPVADTDFMFATIAESTGLLGSSILLALYGIFIWRIWRLSIVVSDPFAMLVAIGVGSMILIQVAVNVGMNIGLLPVTGIPLPFVSYGGSSLVVTVFLVGILERMYLQRQRLQFSR